MTGSVIPVLLPVLPFTAAVGAFLAGLWRPAAARLVALAATSVLSVLSIIGIVSALDHGPLRHDLGGWAPPFGIQYVLDPLAAYVSVVVAVLGLVVVVFPPDVGFGILPDRRAPVHALVLLVIGGLMGVVVTADLFHLFVCLEIFAIASYALVALGGPRAALASVRYLIFGTMASGFYLLGVGYLYFTTGSLGMADVAQQLQGLGSNRAVLLGVGLIVVGLALKMALFPLHVWLPEAHSYAPPAVAALLAGIQVKVAAYALIRILFAVVGVEWVSEALPITSLLVVFGVGGVLYGSVLAIRQDDIKRMLAYSTVAQLGYIGIAIGLATPAALVAALFQVVSHAVMKSSLFLLAGGIAHQTGVREVSRMAGLARQMPITAAATVVALLALVGIPPTAGFFAKWYLLVAAIEEGSVLVAVVVATSTLLTLRYALRVVQTLYRRPETMDPAIAEAAETTTAVWLPAVTLAGATVVLGVLNAYLVSAVLRPIADQVVGA